MLHTENGVCYYPIGTSVRYTGPIIDHVIPAPILALVAGVQFVGHAVTAEPITARHSDGRVYHLPAGSEINRMYGGEPGINMSYQLSVLKLRADAAKWRWDSTSVRCILKSYMPLYVLYFPIKGNSLDTIKEYTHLEYSDKWRKCDTLKYVNGSSLCAA